MVLENESLLLEQFANAIETENAHELQGLLETLSPSETAWAVSRLSHEQQTGILRLLSPEDAASVVEDIGEQHATELLADLPADKAAQIVEEMESDEQADLLNEIHDANETGAQAILELMPKAEAKELRKLMAYDANTAGGLMNTEVLSFFDTQTVGAVRDVLSKNSSHYSDYDIQYVFVITQYKMLVGVIRLRDLVFSGDDTLISNVMIPNPINMKVDSSLAELVELFENYNFIGVPVTDKRNRLVGIVRRSSVLEVVEKLESQSFLRFAGIVGGDELRSMPIRTRSGRRLSWLSINILLNLIGANVIAAYEDTLQQVIALAFFLPIISDMSGCSGNQAVAVSMRELSKGLIRPKEVFRVILKELPIGMLNGAALGFMLGCISALWQWNLAFGAVIGLALAVNTMVSVCLGGMIPLMLKALKLDPALVSSPLLTTITDLCGFFFVLSFASMAMQYIQ